MSLVSAGNKPNYQHTISETETIYIGSEDNCDFYYRYNGIHHNVDIRYSSVPSDYTSWTFEAIHYQYVKDFNLFTKVVPKWVADTANSLAKR